MEGFLFKLDTKNIKENTVNITTLKKFKLSTCFVYNKGKRQIIDWENWTDLVNEK